MDLQGRCAVRLRVARPSGVLGVPYIQLDPSFYRSSSWTLSDQIINGILIALHAVVFPVSCSGVGGGFVQLIQPSVCSSIEHPEAQ